MNLFSFCLFRNMDGAKVQKKNDIHNVYANFLENVS